MEGQLSLFNLLDAPHIIIDRERVFNKLKEVFNLSFSWNEQCNLWETRMGALRLCISFGIGICNSPEYGFMKGDEVIHVDAEYKNGGIGTPCTSAEKAVEIINNYIDRYPEAIGRNKSSDISKKQQTVIPERFKEYSVKDYIPYMVSQLKSNGLLEHIYKGIRGGISSKVLENNDKLVTLFKRTMFNLSKTYFFYADGELFGFTIKKEEPCFKETGEGVLYHCGSDNEQVVGLINVKDIANEFIKSEGIVLQ